MMNKTNKKIFLVLFVSFIFAVAAHFNVYMMFRSNREEILTIVEGERSFSKVSGIAFNTLEKYYEKFFVERESISESVRIDKFIDVYGLVQRALSVDVAFAAQSSETVVKLKDGSLTSTQSAEPKNFSTQASAIKAFSDMLDGYDIDFLLAHAAAKEINAENAPTGVAVPSKSVSDSIADYLEAKKVTFLELKKNPALPADVSEQYYRTDHHWTTETGLASAKYIAEELNRLYGYGLDVELLNEENFDTELHKDVFLGSTGKKIGNLYVGRDDFKLFLPKFETDFTVDITHLEDEPERLNGSFGDALVFREHLDRDYYQINTYCTYLGGDYPITVIENNNTSSDKSILVIKDSYANAVVPFLSMTVKKITLIDPRYYTGSIRDYIAEENPDAVLMIYNSGAFFEDAFWTFE